MNKVELRSHYIINKNHDKPCPDTDDNKSCMYFGGVL